MPTAPAASALTLRVQRVLLHPAAKLVVVTVLMAPLVALIWGAAHDTLGANPAETLIRNSGEMTLRCLLLTLAITPLREATGIGAFIRLRRTLGLLSFAWALLHGLSYAWLDMGWVLSDILRDIAKRPFILIGTLSLLLMLPLAATSFNAAIKALGAARWKALHRAVYAIGVLTILHFWWMRSGKAVYDEVWVYGGLMAALLAWRLRALVSIRGAVRQPP